LDAVWIAFRPAVTLTTGDVVEAVFVQAMLEAPAAPASCNGRESCSRVPVAPVVT